MTILNHDYIKNSITRNQGKEEVAYRWSHGATDMHLGDGLLIYSLIQFHKFKNFGLNCLLKKLSLSCQSTSPFTPLQASTT